ncbi:MAG: nuclear transport factor 2 family protein [Rhodoblastus sp.]
MCDSPRDLVWEPAPDPAEQDPSVDDRRQEILGILSKLLELKASGDVEALLAFATPDVAFRTSVGRNHPFHADCNGFQACADMARAVYVVYENLGSRINRVLIEGDRVAMHRTVRIRNRGTGRAVDVDMWNFLTFRGRLVAEISEYPDMAAFAELDAHNQ